MEIKEVETLLHVSRSSIRFYEKAGLLHPQRRDNKYRNYSSEEDGSLACGNAGTGGRLPPLRRLSKIFANRKCLHGSMRASIPTGLSEIL